MPGRRSHFPSGFACFCAALWFAILFATVSQSAHGAVIEAWVQRYNGPANSNDFAQAVAMDASGNVVVTGYSYSSNSAMDYYTAKYAPATGALLWEQRYNGRSNSYDYAFAVAVDANRNVIVTGRSFNGSDFDYHTVKYAGSDGTVLWEKRYNGPGNTEEDPCAVAVDSNGNVVVTGYSGASGIYGGYYTAKYAAADGALVWEKRSDGDGKRYDFAQALAVDGSGNVVVTGYSEDSNDHTDYYTAKYASANGALLWEKRYDGPANGDDVANAVAVDASGNVVVTGTSNGTNGYPNYYTAKYAAADGALLWEKRYGDPLNLFNYSYAVAVDGSGNAIVTGSSDADYYTAKYSAANGALLWEKRYNGPANNSDSATAVMVDGTGNVVVTGYSERTGPNYDNDYYTAKYAAADGALLWEKRYNASADLDDQVTHGLALGPNGMVAITGHSDGDLGAGLNIDYATVVYWEKLPPISIAVVPAGIRLHFRVPPERRYIIERAPAVTGPWTSNATVMPLLGGWVDYIDTNAPAGSAFYRTSLP